MLVRGIRAPPPTRPREALARHYSGLGETTPRLPAWYARVASRSSVGKELAGLMAASRAG